MAPGRALFPEMEIAPVEGALPDPEVVAERLAILQRLTHSEDAAGTRQSAAGKVSPEHAAQQERASEIIVVTRAALNEAVPDSEQMRSLEVRLTRGDTTGRDALLARLTDAGYERVSQVSQRGQFAVRGGIVDVFSFQHTLPVRLEFFGDELESIRHFDLDAQTSVEQLQTCTLLLGQAASRERRLRDCIGEEDITVDVAADWLEADVTIGVDSVAENFTTEDTESTDEGAGNSEGDSFMSPCRPCPPWFKHRHSTTHSRFSKMASVNLRPAISSWTRRGASGSSRSSPSGARRAGARSSFATTRARSSGCTT